MPPLDPAVLAARRQALVDAAAQCLDRDGPEGVTARSVAAEAGVSVGALYHHFVRIDALWEALAEQRLVAGIATVAARAPAGEDPMTWAVRSLVCGPPLGAPSRPGAAAPEGVGREVRATVDEVLRAAAAVGRLRPDVDAEALGELLELLWEGVDRRVAEDALRTTPERLAGALADALDRGVRPPTIG